MANIKGKIKFLIYEGDNGYKVGQIQIKSTDDETLEDLVNKTITFTGYFLELNSDDTYNFCGEYNYHEKYGYQFNVSSYSRVKPVGKDAVVEFLSSSLIAGCGIKTAQKIVDVLGENAINIIKEDPSKLLLADKISEKKAVQIYNSIMKYAKEDELILNLQKLGFSLKETMIIIDKYHEKSEDIIKENIYQLIDIVDFKKLDYIFLHNYDANDPTRIKACIIEGVKRLEFINGDTYHNKKELENILIHDFHLVVDSLDEYLNNLALENKLYLEDEQISLYETYCLEKDIAHDLERIKNSYLKKLTNLEEDIKKLEDEFQVKYNKEQKEAIKSALNNNICIITGGPGVGKTTIINAIVKLYIGKYNLRAIDILNNIALLAPTGRAAKKISESTNIPAMTIHRFLKWNKDSDTFSVNEDNKNYQRLIIVDETSMIDTHLFASLLKGIYSNVQLILVGDENQLPSVGAGLILNDLIKSQNFKHVNLNQIYRQSQNSYIPYLAKEIKEYNLTEEFLVQKDDYNFLSVSDDNIKNTIKQICLMCKEKKVDEKNIQILAPMYKGINGIDNLNIILQNLFNPQDEKKKEIKIGDIIYREKDKVIMLINDPDNNVFNGDIGYIHKIQKDGHNKDVVTIDFDGNYVEFKREDMNNLKHAYAMSIHKSQGSEFNHVLMPITSSYSKMLYNKLIYTGVSRAKKSLVIIGDSNAFIKAVNNSYSTKRHTNLYKEIKKLMSD